MTPSTCIQQPYSAATFGLPIGTLADGTKVTASVSGLSNNGDCSNVSTVAVPGGSRQIHGTGNSVRGAVTGNAGKCLDVENTDYAQLEWAEDADLPAVENRAAVVESGRQRPWLDARCRPHAAPGERLLPRRGLRRGRREEDPGDRHHLRGHPTSSVISSSTPLASGPISS
ncbi:hypothetical protein ABZ478_19540 [Streptomyces sp. NPDC005706]|uniref:hypothetical protein n=1 Tax=Streptomyces sp. NPDC005706 TaxID=3157169 RepID=UPI0033EB0175